MTVEAHYLEEVRLGTERLKREINYHPTYFNRMVGELGPIEATRRLVHSATPSEGFTHLWEHHRLDMTVEALVLLPWYADLFDDEERRLARARLEAYQFDVDGFLASRTTSPPPWAGADDR